MQQGDDDPHIRARIAWLSPDGKGESEARRQFASAGYFVSDWRDGNETPDLAVIDLRRRRASLKGAKELVKAIRRAAPDCALLYLAPVDAPASERAFLRRTGELVVCADDLGAAIHACRLRLRLRNVAEEAGERLKSVAASTRLAEFPPIETTTTSPRVLIAGAPGAPALAALSAAAGVSSEVVAALSAPQAMRAIETGGFDCAVILPRGEGDPLIGLARTLRRHRRFQDLPVVCVPPLPAASGRAYPWANETILLAHADTDLGARIVALTRRARLARALRRFLNACAGEGVRDRASGAFAPQFFALHAARLFARADHTGRPLAVAAVRLSVAGADAPDPSATGALTDAARLINRVTRAEDFVARLSSDTFVILMASTTRQDCASAAKRIEGVIANTMFRLKSDSGLFAAAAVTAAIERTPKMRPEEAVAAVLSGLERAPPRIAEQ